MLAIGGFPCGSDGEVSTCNVGDLGSTPGSGRSPGEGKWQPTPLLLPRKFNAWRSLVGWLLGWVLEITMKDQNRCSPSLGGS